jgi:hypothetical protein
VRSRIIPEKGEKGKGDFLLRVRDRLARLTAEA